MREEIDKIWSALHRHESRLRNMNLEKMFKQFYKRKLRFERQSNTYKGIHLALCVDTRDPWKQNRIRYFSPVMDLPPDLGSHFTTLGQCDWAWPISPAGGFDDCGQTWVPPPGTTVALVFQNGNPNMAFYIGTTWQRDKGPENTPNWGYDIPEYGKIFKGHRKGYMVGKNDESQAKPSWDTDNYQGYDFDTSVDIDLVPDAQTKTTWPHIYGWTTPEKHRIKLDDGDPKCNRRYKRIEILSSMGNYFLMKDDPYHYCGEWVNPKCKLSFTDVIPDICTPSFVAFSNISFTGISLVAVAYPCAQGPENCPTISETDSATVDQEYLGTEAFCPAATPMAASSEPVTSCLGILKGFPDHCFSFDNSGKNKYHKHRQECFPFFGDRCGLPQSGVQILSRSKHGFVMDDSVEEPRDRPEWERTLKPFDMDGCTGVFKGRTWWRSATGHFIELNDQEINPKVRGPQNGITIGTACGNTICLNDHTVGCCVAGENRGIHIKSTAEHSLVMSDDTNQQASPERDGCAKTGAYSQKAFVRLRSGYGLTLMMNDAQNQQKTDQQYIQLLSPQKDNLQRGPHMLHMQENATGPGQVFLRAGGDYVVYSYDQMVEVVGNEDENPANKLEFVSNMKIVSVKDVYYNRAKTHVFYSDDFIFLLAGNDCAPKSEGEDTAAPDAQGTCVYPVVVATGPIPEFITYMTNMKASEHVFASALKPADDPCEGIASDL